MELSDAAFVELALAKGTRALGLAPSQDAAAVVEVAMVARQHGHQLLTHELVHANCALFGLLEQIWVVRGLVKSQHLQRSSGSRTSPSIKLGLRRTDLLHLELEGTQAVGLFLSSTLSPVTSEPKLPT